MKTFIEKCIAGEANLEEIDDYVEKWHNGDGRNMELYEYLGMTKQEYSVWMLKPNEIENIINDRK